MSNVSIGVLSLYEVFAYYFVYSFLGWIAEVCFHAIKYENFANRGFLNGPLCPIYGYGVTFILLILGKWVEKPWAVLLVGIALPTLLELVGGWAMEKLFHNKWWDYSNRKLNFKGYICLEFSILWGLAAVCVICVLHPAIKWLINLIPDPYATIAISILLAVYVADNIVTFLQLGKFNKKLKELDTATKVMRIGSDAIGKKIADVSIVMGGKAGAAKEKINQTYEKAVDTIVAKMPQRILNAFPTLQSRKNPDAVPIAKESVKRIKRRKKKNPETEVANEIVADNSDNSN